MLDHVRRQVTDMICRKVPLEIEIVAAAEVERHGDKRFIHRKAEAVPSDAPLVAKRSAQRHAKRDGAVLDGVVRVNMQVAVTFQL